MKSWFFIFVGLVLAAVPFLCFIIGQYLWQCHQRKKAAAKKTPRRLSINELTPQEFWEGISAITQSGLKNGYVIVSRSFSSTSQIMVCWGKPEEEILDALNGSEFSIENFMESAKILLRFPEELADLTADERKRRIKPKK